uniref:RdRp catalytic domain-containing protein n=1 Tax=Trichuris muris TaxID=70415 RepID=A0A5S6QK51_TRIMR
MDYDAVLCLCDVLEQRYLIAWEDLEVVLEWVDSHLRLMVNEAINIIKMYEPLCTAMMLKKDKNPLLNSDYIEQRLSDYRVSGGSARVHSKERELKIEPRLYVMMVLEMHLYYCITEMNLAETIFKYLPQRTMTSSEADLTTRLLLITGQTTTKQRRSMFYLVSRLCPPGGVSRDNRSNPPASDTVWYDDESGKEGIRQKGWTMITISTLIYVGLITGTPSIITGQGDNQVIIASFPVTGSLTPEEYVNDCGSILKQRVNQYMNILISTS